jgi:hypothetical protein
MWTWKRESFWLIGAIAVALVAIYFWTHQSPPQQTGISVRTLPDGTVIRAGYVDPPPAPKTSSTDWSKCLQGTATPDKDKKGFNVLIVNTCSVVMNPFSVRFKFYDESDARVGWYREEVSALQPNEKVRWWAEYPVKDYPQLEKFGVARIQVFDYDKGTN